MIFWWKEISKNESLNFYLQREKQNFGRDFKKKKFKFFSKKSIWMGVPWNAMENLKQLKENQKNQKNKIPLKKHLLERTFAARQGGKSDVETKMINIYVMTINWFIVCCCFWIFRFQFSCFLKACPYRSKNTKNAKALDPFQCVNLKFFFLRCNASMDAFEWLDLIGWTLFVFFFFFVKGDENVWATLLFLVFCFFFFFLSLGWRSKIAVGVRIFGSWSNKHSQKNSYHTICKVTN